VDRLTAIDPHKLNTLEAEVDDLVERLTYATTDDDLLIAEQQVDSLLAAIDQLIEPATLH
jgi:hypothetical protein